jgi:hypothetical protein
MSMMFEYTALSMFDRNDEAKDAFEEALQLGTPYAPLLSTPLLFSSLLSSPLLPSPLNSSQLNSCQLLSIPLFLLTTFLFKFIYVKVGAVHI